MGKMDTISCYEMGAITILMNTSYEMGTMALVMKWVRWLLL